MAVDAFWLRVALSFVLGGLTVALFTTAAERLGSRVGGLLLSFPVKVTIAMILIGLNEGADVAGAAAAATPLGLGINLVFLTAAALFVRKLQPWPALLSALGVWLAFGLLVLFLVDGSARLGVALWLVTVTLALVLVPRAKGVQPKKRAPETFGLLGLLSRAAGAGAVVAASIVLARFAGPVLGGLAAVFPSGWITTMVILTRHHGPEFTGATVRVMAAGSAAPLAFGLVVAWTYPLWGVWLGTAAAMGVALLVSLTVGAWLRYVRR